MLPRPQSYCEARKQKPKLIAEMDRLLEDHNDGDVARILNEKGFTTGDSLPLTRHRVCYILKAYGLKSRFDRLRERGLLSLSEVAQKCGVSTQTILRWRSCGRLCAYPFNDRNWCLYENPGPNPPKKGIHLHDCSFYEEVQYEA
jgi:hypothetical protein